MSKPSDFLSALIITTYDAPAVLETSLRSVQRQSVIPNKIYVADDGSGAETASVIRSFRDHLPIEHIWHEDDGFRRSAIINKAIRAAEEDYLVFIDGDEILHAKFIEDHISAAVSGTVVLGSRCNFARDLREPPQDVPSFFKLLHMFLCGRIINDVRTEETSVKSRSVGFTKGIRMPVKMLRPCSERKARGGNMAAWRTDLVAVNGFDEEFRGWGFEDLDLVLRLMKVGVKPMQLLFQAICFHIDHPCNPPSEANRSMIYGNRPARCKIGIVKEPAGANTQEMVMR